MSLRKHPLECHFHQSAAVLRGLELVPAGVDARSTAGGWAAQRQNAGDALGGVGIAERHPGRGDGRR